MKIAAVFGARPQFIKAAPLLEELGRRRQLQLTVIHSGQHYDIEMSQRILDDLGIRKPTVTLVVRSPAGATQIAEMLVKIGRSLRRYGTERVIVFGDTNTTLAGALAASKLNLPVGHVEAGARSFDFTMPEEINRRIVDHCSELLFAPTKTALGNLMKEGIRKSASFMTGDTMVDALVITLPRIEHEKKKVLGDLNLEPRNYGLLTLHRPGNVDDPAALQRILKVVTKLSRHVKFLFPIHPHTRKSLARFKLRRLVRQSFGLAFIKPLAYTRFLGILSEASVVLTDSGGVQKEAFLLRTPCITLRETTEWPETFEAGANVLVGSNARSIERHTRRALDQETILQGRKIRRRSLFGDGRASARIAMLVSEWPRVQNA